MAAAWKRSEAANCFFESAGLGTEANERSTPKKKCWVLALSYISNNRHGVCGCLRIKVFLVHFIKKTFNRSNMLLKAISPTK